MVFADTEHGTMCSIINCCVVVSQVSEVLQFIQDLPGCCVYADEFSRQEIDGQALMLLKEDHLMTTMNIKLGPALKICARINTLKDELS